jgi:hypothetical protein
MPFLIWPIKSCASFCAAGSLLFSAATAAASPFRMMSSSTFMSRARQFMVETNMMRALSTSHLRARRKRSTRASGWSCFTMLQMVSRIDSGDWLARVS